MKRDKILECIDKVLHIPLKNFIHFSDEQLIEWINIKLNNSKEKNTHKMRSTYRSERSENGFDLSVLKSGLQKYIRRGNEEMALRVVEELDRFAEIEGGERIRTNMLHRLQVIFLEDIGLGNYHLWKQMTIWMDILFKADRKNIHRDRSTEIQTLEKIVRNLCRSKKTRSCSFMRSITQLIDSDEKIVNEHFGGYYLKTENDTKILLKCLNDSLSQKSWKSIFYLMKLFNLSERKSAPLKEIEKIMGKYVNLENSIKWKKDILHLEIDGYLLYMLPLGFYLYDSEPLQLHETDLITEIGQWPMLGSFKMDDFVYDKHTKCAKNRSTEYFVTETSKVSNEVFRLPREFKAIYEWSRCGKIIPKLKDITQIERETDMDFKTRIQLTTSDSKQDTYYATFHDELYFVKGPFSDRKVVDQYIHFQTLKKERGMPYIEVYCVMIYPDLWKPEEIPLGYRKKIDPSKKYPFLISKSLFPIKSLKFKMHSSVKWPITKVVDDHETEGMRVDVSKLEGQMMIDYLEALAFRLEFNIGDFADRNFLKISGISFNDETKDPTRVLSIDEEIIDKKIDLKSQLRSKYDIVKKAVEKYKDRLNPKTVEILRLA